MRDPFESGGVLSPEIDRELGILRSRKRRLVLYLLKTEGDLDVSDIVHHESNEVVEHEVELFHNHLPKLERSGHIEWRRDADTVSKGPRFGEIEPFLELLVDYFAESSS